MLTESVNLTGMASSPAALEAFTRLVDIMATLRGPDGCPWDREQTIDTLKPFVLEETYELLEAVDAGDHAAIREELGDFLFEAVFIAQLESEAGHFDIADALVAVGDKLVRRHPHIFARGEGAGRLDSSAEVKQRWEEIKAQERTAAGEKPKRLLDGIPGALPALVRADQISRRARSVGFDWPRAIDVVSKMEEEVAEIREVVDAAPKAGLDLTRAEEEVGDLLFAIASLSRKLGVDPETALRKANQKFARRFTGMEVLIEERGQSMSALSLDELEACWQQVKK